MIFITSLFTAIIVFSEAQVPEKRIERINFGVHFDAQGIIDVSTSKWHSTFVIKMPIYQERDDLVEIPCTDEPLIDLTPKQADGNSFDVHLRSRNLTTMAPETGQEQLLNDICQIFNAYLDEKRNLSKAITSRLIQTDLILPSSTNRDERAIFGFLGSFAHDLTGLALQSDVDKLNNHIDAYQQLTRENREQIVTIGNTVEHLIEIQSKSTRLLEKAVQLNAKRTDIVTKYLKEDIQTVKRDVTDLILDLHWNGVLQGNVLRDILYNADLQLEATEILLKGYLPKYFVSPEDIKMSLEHINAKLADFHGEFSLVYTEIGSYYTLKDVTFSRRNDTLFIKLGVPISNQHNAMFYLYRLYLTPMPITPDHEERTVIDLENEYFGISKEKQLYITLSHEEIQMCRGAHVKRCPQYPLIHKWSDQNCYTALYEDNFDAVMKYCKVILANQKEQQVRVLFIEETSQFLVSGLKKEKATIICQGKAERPLSCDSCLLRLPCHCHLESKKHLLSSNINTCNMTADVEITHPLNLPALAQFIPPEQLQHFNSKSFLNVTPNTNIPRLAVVNNMLEGVLKEEDSSHISLKKIAEHIKNGKKMYVSNSAKLIDRLGFLAKETVAKSTPIISWIALVLSTFALLLTIYANCRMFAFIPVARAVDFNLQEKSTTQLPGKSNDDNDDDQIMHHVYNSIGHVTVIIIVIGIMIVLYKIYLSYMKHRQEEKEAPIHSRILAVFYSKTEVVVQHIMVSPLAGRDVKMGVRHVFRKPRTSFNTLHFDWSFLNINVILPERVQVPTMSIFAIKKILKDLTCFKIVAVQGTDYFEIYKWDHNAFLLQSKLNLHRTQSMRLPRLTRHAEFEQPTPTAPPI